MKGALQFKRNIGPLLSAGLIGVFGTDTLYGMLGSALKKEVVEKIYFLRKRDLGKPMIILISSLDDLNLFSVKINGPQKRKLMKIWPGAVSVVLECGDGKFEYLHRGSKTLAFRMPADPELRSLLEISGPLVAPSANIAGQEPAKTYSQARAYFQNEVDFYVDDGALESEPSTIVSFGENGDIEVLRQGAVRF